MLIAHSPTLFFFFFNDTATTEIYTLSLHDALPIWTRPISQGIRLAPARTSSSDGPRTRRLCSRRTMTIGADRKSTRLNSSHGYISYAVFCLKKKKNTTKESLTWIITYIDTTPTERR